MSSMYFFVMLKGFLLLVLGAISGKASLIVSLHSDRDL